MSNIHLKTFILTISAFHLAINLDRLIKRRNVPLHDVIFHLLFRGGDSTIDVEQIDDKCTTMFTQ